MYKILDKSLKDQTNLLGLRMSKTYTPSRSADTNWFVSVDENEADEIGLCRFKNWITDSVNK